MVYLLNYQHIAKSYIFFSKKSSYYNNFLYFCEIKIDR